MPELDSMFDADTWENVSLVEIQEGKNRISYVCQKYEIDRNWLKLKRPYVYLSSTTRKFLDQEILEFAATILDTDDVKIKTFKRDVFLKLYKEKAF